MKKRTFKNFINQFYNCREDKLAAFMERAEMIEMSIAGYFSEEYGMNEFIYQTLQQGIKKSDVFTYIEAFSSGIEYPDRKPIRLCYVAYFIVQYIEHEIDLPDLATACLKSKIALDDFITCLYLFEAGMKYAQTH